MSTLEFSETHRTRSDSSCSEFDLLEDADPDESKTEPNDSESNRSEDSNSQKCAEISFTLLRDEKWTTIQLTEENEKWKNVPLSGRTSTENAEDKRITGHNSDGVSNPDENKELLSLVTTEHAPHAVQNARAHGPVDLLDTEQLASASVPNPDNTLDPLVLPVADNVTSAVLKPANLQDHSTANAPNAVQNPGITQEPVTLLNTEQLASAPMPNPDNTLDPLVLPVADNVTSDVLKPANLQDHSTGNASNAAQNPGITQDSVILPNTEQLASAPMPNPDNTLDPLVLPVADNVTSDVLKPANLQDHSTGNAPNAVQNPGITQEPVILLNTEQLASAPMPNPDNTLDPLVLPVADNVTSDVLKPANLQDHSNGNAPNAVQNPGITQEPVILLNTEQLASAPMPNPDNTLDPLVLPVADNVTSDVRKPANLQDHSTGNALNAVQNPGITQEPVTLLNTEQLASAPMPNPDNTLDPLVLPVADNVTSDVLKPANLQDHSTGNALNAVQNPGITQERVILLNTEQLASAPMPNPDNTLDPLVLPVADNVTSDVLKPANLQDHPTGNALNAVQNPGITQERVILLNTEQLASAPMPNPDNTLDPLVLPVADNVTSDVLKPANLQDHSTGNALNAVQNPGITQERVILLNTEQLASAPVPNPESTRDLPVQPVADNVSIVLKPANLQDHSTGNASNATQNPDITKSPAKLLVKEQASSREPNPNNAQDSLNIPVLHYVSGAVPTPAVASLTAEITSDMSLLESVPPKPMQADLKVSKEESSHPISCVSPRKNDSNAVVSAHDALPTESPLDTAVYPVRNSNALESLSRLSPEKFEMLNKLTNRNVLIRGEISADIRSVIAATPSAYVLNSGTSWSDSIPVFLNMMENPDNAGAVFVYIDSELLNPAKPHSSNHSTIHHYRQGVLIFEDVVEEQFYAPEAKRTVPAEPSEKPRKCGTLELPCPGSGCFSRATYIWKCKSCSSSLEYGFDGSFYCTCGRAPAKTFVFHCGLKKHGKYYAAFEPDVLDSLLLDIKPFEEINILILGETGVGKSTFINGFVNFLTYSSLGDALADPVYLIPANFTTLDENFEERLISMGSSDNEDTVLGQSATQMPRSYVFKKGNTIVRLIDTPGIGDTRGTEQDKKNFQYILQHLANYEKINGICILLKPNNSRLTVMFRFCIKELLTHLHRNACHNISFIFTNARSTFYRPGDTFPILKKLLKDSQGVNIELNQNTVYCVDSEAVRFMAALKEGLQFTQTDTENFYKSWEKSVEETERLMQHIMTRIPHPLQNTISLNEVRRLILSFTEPLTHVTKTIQLNLTLADERAEEIKAAVASKDALNDKLYVPVVDLKTVQLDFPRTVCTAQKCIRMVGQKVNYVTWCHDHCYLKGVIVDQYPTPELKNCKAIRGADKCRHCGCPWEKHMHITYDLQEVHSRDVDASIQKLLNQKSGQIAAVQKVLHEIQQRKDRLKAEEMEIRKVAVKLGYFLKKNAMLPYNDAIEEYLHYLISAEREKIAIGATRTNLHNYENMLNAYQEEKQFLEEAMQLQDHSQQITMEDVTRDMQSLYHLTINGQKIQEMVEMVQNTRSQESRHLETFYMPNVPKRNTTQSARNRLQKCFDSLNPFRHRSQR